MDSSAPRISRTGTKVPLLDCLPPATRAALLGRRKVRRYDGGVCLWRQGEPASGIAIVMSGSVRIVRIGSRGRQTVLHTGREGETLGEVPFFAGDSYPATAITAEPTECLFLSREDVEELLRATPATGWLLLAHLAQRIRELVDRLDQAALQTVDVKLARYILARRGVMAKRAGFATNASSAQGAAVLSLGMSQAALAQELGTVREVLVRSLRRLCDAGALAPRGRGLYRVVDIATLRRLADDA